MPEILQHVSFGVGVCMAEIVQAIYQRREMARSSFNRPGSNRES